jgi:RND superfamily putative drug exporter
MEFYDNPESRQAQTILDERLGKGDGNLTEMIIVRSQTLTVDDAEYRSQVEAVFSGAMALGQDVVLGGANYYMTGDASMVSPDRHSTLIVLKMPRGESDQVEKIYAVTDGYEAGGTFEIFHTGDASFTEDTTKLAEDTMKTGETIGIMVALVVLAIVFGALAAAFLPIALGVVAIVVALGLAALVGQAMDLTFTITNMITMMGLAVGIDYSLFILSRFREERQRGLDKIEAIAVTGATASKAVFFSGITVMLALGGLIIFPMSIFKTMGIGAELVVFGAVAAAMTLLPAILSLLGDKVNRLRIPFVPAPRLEKQGEAVHGFWARTTRAVTRLPVVSLVLAVAILGSAAFQYTDISTGMSGISGIPDDLPAKEGFLVLQKEFHLGFDAPAVVVVDGDVGSASVRTGIAGLQSRIAADSVFSGSVVAPHADKDLTVIYAGIAGDPLARPAMEAVARLRSDYIPESFESSDARVLVTGQTAGIIDFNQTTSEYTPIIFGFVLLLSFVILTLAFRSVVIPAKAILMNLLSVGASYGLIVLVFQKGVGNRLFGFQQVDVIESWLPLFLFALLFGLSMDYHVFLLSRISEHFQQTGDNTESVSYGLRTTGRLITGAALIMVAVFGGFALGSMTMFQQMGFGLAVAVFLDATLVRCVLVPASMKLLGKYNWYLPKWLQWMPDLGLGEQAEVRSVPEAPRHRLPAARPVPGAVSIPVLVEEDAVSMRSQVNSRLDRNGRSGDYG